MKQVYGVYHDLFLIKIILLDWLFWVLREDYLERIMDVEVQSSIYCSETATYILAFLVI